MSFENLKEVFNKIKEFVSSATQFTQNNTKTLKILGIVVVVIVAFLFFNGEDEGEIIIENEYNNVAQENATTTSEEDNESDDTTSNHTDTQYPPNSSQNESIGYVDVGGEVNNPGVYPIFDGDRVFSLIEKAGGLTVDADISAINQASPVEDGQKIYIPQKGEFSTGSYTENNVGSQNESKININYSNQTDLEEIPGVGPATAKSIIQYREEHGHFAKIEDIVNVSGIGKKTFESMKDYITVY